MSGTGLGTGVGRKCHSEQNTVSGAKEPWSKERDGDGGPEADFSRAEGAIEESQGGFLRVPCLSWDPLACSCSPSAWTIPFNPWDQTHMAALLSIPLSWTCPPAPLTSWSLFSVSEAIGICPWHFFLILPGLVLSSMQMTSEPMSLSRSFLPEIYRYLPAGSSPLEILLSQTLAHLEHGVFLLNPTSWDIQRSWAGAGENACLFFFGLFT